MSVNVFICMGNLARDPELRYLPSGNAVANGSIALNHVWTTAEGEKKEEVSFIDFAAFGKTAETICKYFKKGAMIHLQGSLKQERWEDKQTGDKKSRVKIQVERFSFTGQKTDGAGTESAPRAQARPAAKKTSDNYSPPQQSDEDSDIPF